jgi:hypothetical protein
MITLADIRDWLKSFGLFDNYYIGRIDSKKKNSLGVYNLQDAGRREVIGGLKVYEKKGVSLLIHGDTNKANTERKAWDLYNAIESVSKNENILIAKEKKVFFIELLNNEPIDVNQDSDSVYEYVIEMNIYFEK